MKNFKIIILLVVGSFSYLAYAKKTQLSTRYEKGFFSIGTMLGHSETILLNQDGTNSNFSGYGYGIDLDISIKPLLGVDIRIFGAHFICELNQSSRVYELESQNTSIGIRYFANEFLYLSLGSGSIQQKLKSEGSELELKNDAIMGGIGFVYPISESLTLGLGVNKTVNPIKKTDSTVGNSFSESNFYFLNINWSPPSTTIYMSNREL